MRITEKTTFTLHMGWLFAGALVATVGYFTTDHLIIVSQGSEIADLKAVQKDYQKSLTNFDRKLTQVMTKMNIPVEDDK